MNLPSSLVLQCCFPDVTLIDIERVKFLNIVTSLQTINTRD